MGERCDCVYCSLFRRLDTLEKGIRDGHVAGALLAHLREVREAVDGLVEHAVDYEGQTAFLMDEVEQAAARWVPRKRLRRALRTARYAPMNREHSAGGRQ